MIPITNAEAPAPTLPTLARAIGTWFPELNGRSIAVAEAKAVKSKDALPTLPIAIVALAQETGNHSPKSNADIPMADDVVVEFWMPVERYRKEDDTESPFWAYYDYEPVRDRLLYRLRDWISPRGGKMRFLNIDIDADDYCVAICFRFRHEFNWCAERSRIEQPVPVVGYEVQICLEPVEPACPAEPTEPDCPPGTF